MLSVETVVSANMRKLVKGRSTLINTIVIITMIGFMTKWAYVIHSTQDENLSDIVLSWRFWTPDHIFWIFGLGIPLSSLIIIYMIKYFMNHWKGDNIVKMYSD